MPKRSPRSTTASTPISTCRAILLGPMLTEGLSMNLAERRGFGVGFALQVEVAPPCRRPSLMLVNTLLEDLLESQS